MESKMLDAKRDEHTKEQTKKQIEKQTEENSNCDKTRDTSGNNENQEIQKAQKDELKKEMVRGLKFGLFSISAGVIEIVSFSLLNELTKWRYWPCYVIALILSVLWNFTLNRRYTFRSASNVTVAMIKIFAFYLVYVPASTMLGNYLADTLLWNEYLVTLINMLANFILEFLYDRYFVFRNSLDTNRLAKHP